jgi:cardiolipin synthase
MVFAVCVSRAVLSVMSARAARRRTRKRGGFDGHHGTTPTGGTITIRDDSGSIIPNRPNIITSGGSKIATETTIIIGALLTIGTALFSSCGAIPDANALLHANPLYVVDSKFIGPEGPLTTRHARLIIARLKEHQKIPSDILERHLAFEQAISGVPLVLGNKVTLLKNGAATYDAMLAAIRSAHNSVNIEMFEFSSGPIGQMFGDALIERQMHGVQVNLIYDSFGSIGTPNSFFDHLRQNGIAVLQYRPLNPFKAKLTWSLTHRSHRKMLIIDGSVAFVGGINISEVYASGLGSNKSKTPPAYWRDTDVEIQGPAVAEFQQLFVGEWYYQKGPLLKGVNCYPSLPHQGDQIVRVLASLPQQFSLIYVDLISAIDNAETNIYVTDAYFVPDIQMVRAFERAARRGVDVRLLLPSQSDQIMIVSAEHSHYERLLKSGVKIYEWQGEMLHAKTATIDGVWSTVGSSNLDWWSIARDNELNVMVLSHSFGAEMEAMFRADTENSSQIGLAEWNHRGLVERIREMGGRIVAPLL